MMSRLRSIRTQKSFSLLVRKIGVEKWLA